MKQKGRQAERSGKKPTKHVRLVYRVNKKVKKVLSKFSSSGDPKTALAGQERYFQKHLDLVKMLERELISEWLRLSPSPTKDVLTVSKFREEMANCANARTKKNCIRKWMLLTHPDKQKGYNLLFRTVHEAWTALEPAA